MQSFFRYPGGKSKFSDQIIQAINDHEFIEYREPFIGGGSIALDFITNGGCDVWINDKDIGIYCLWKAIADHPNELTELIRAFSPSTDEFYRLKQFFLEAPQASNDNDVVQIGFGKLAIHQISFSGLGVKSGGPLGGQKQSSKYPIDCRWSANYIAKKVDRLHHHFNNVKITNEDYSVLFAPAAHKVMIYLDPPYFEKGEALYQHSFTLEEHIRLSELLRATEHGWVLSYDDCDAIRELYAWATVREMDANYSISGATKKRELLISRT